MDTPIEFTLKNWSRTYIICPILNKNKYVSHLMQLLCKVHVESTRTRLESAESVRGPHGQVGHCKLLQWTMNMTLDIFNFWINITIYCYLNLAYLCLIYA